MYIKYIMCF